jgi:ribose-phosphate pyrophosphokinase
MGYTLNLTDKEKSEIKYEISKFPDGQQSVTIKSSYLPSHAYIQTRLTSFKDLEILICATQSLKELGVETIDVFISYFLGARSDRKFSHGGCNYLKTVICPIINSQNYTGVTILDPHSDVLEACINNFKKFPGSMIATKAMEKLGLKPREYAIISPDAGALKKIYDIAQVLGYEDNIIVASKHRDIKSGQIVSTQVPFQAGDYKHNNFVIFDDICDGGRTFIEIAKQIKEVRGYDSKIYLVVTHGIFSSGLFELSKWFDGIVCTNSFSNLDVEAHSDYTVPATFVKQISII